MAKLVRDYVDSLSADEKTDEATYAARLNICRTCDDLHSGTCEDAKCPPGGDSMWVMCIMRHTAHRFLLTGTSSIDSC